MSRAKELLKSYLEEQSAGGGPRWVRKTEFIPQPDGSVRRRIVRHDGTVEKGEIIPAEQRQVIAAREATGLSQEDFAGLLGVSKRTVQE